MNAAVGLRRHNHEDHLTRLCLYALFALGLRAQTGPTFEELRRLYQYDQRAPLDIREESRSTAGAAQIVSLVYLGGRCAVSGFLITPSGAGKHPAVIFAHDLSTKADEFLSEAISLANEPPNAVSLLIDAPPVRPPGWRRNFNPQIENNDRDIQIQAVIDLRRGIDLLAARLDVDPTRIAFVGHGHGANWGAVLLSIEPRLRMFVLIAGVVSTSDAMRKDDPEFADMKYSLGKESFERYLASIAQVDPIRYLPHSLGAAVLLQFGRFDPYIPADQAQRFASAARGQVVTYDSGHAVNDPKAFDDRRKFLLRHLQATRKR